VRRREPRPNHKLPPPKKKNPEEREPAGKPWLSVRPAKVERARKLIRDPNYPDSKTIDSVARLLAKHLKS
jgi:hypothetical protein